MSYCPPGGQAKTSVLVLLLEGVHALDFAGPVQAIYEANGFGAAYRLDFVGSSEGVRAAQGFSFGDLKPLPELAGDEWILVPGTESRSLDSLEVPADWLRSALANGCRIASVCTGAFALAMAGLLDGRRCTTHWKVVDRLRHICPGARVDESCLYVRDGKVITSAGEASGIDMALSLIEEDCGSRVAAQVAREMVVYIRRNGQSTQRSVYLEHRSHLHPGVHRVQDWIVQHPREAVTLQGMAEVASLSPRHLSRVFRQATGTTVKAFSTLVKLEVAHQLLASDRTIEQIAGHCGFRDTRQFRRLWQERFGRSPSEGRRKLQLSQGERPC